jgi:hypothetical protein
MESTERVFMMGFSPLLLFGAERLILRGGWGSSSALDMKISTGCAKLSRWIDLLDISNEERHLQEFVLGRHGGAESYASLPGV